MASGGAGISGVAPPAQKGGAGRKGGGNVPARISGIGPPAQKNTAGHSGTRGGGYIPRAPKGGNNKGSRPAPAGSGYNAPLYQPNQPLSGKTLADAAKGIADTQINQPIADLRASANQNNKTSAATQKTDFGYYMQLAAAAKNAVATQQAQGSQLQSQLQGISAGTQAQLGQLGQAASGGALARMQALGLDAGQTQSLAADAAHQQGTGVLQSGVAQNLGAQQSANRVGETGAIQGATGLAGIERIGAVARANTLANQPINQKISDLQASRGNLTATALGQLRDKERNYNVAQEGILATEMANTQKNTLAYKTLEARLKAVQAADATRISIANAGNRTRTNIANANNQTRQRGQDITHQNDLSTQAGRRAALLEKTGNDQATQAYRQLALNEKLAAKGGTSKPLPASSNLRIWGDITHIEGLIHAGQTDRALSASGKIPKTLSNGKPNPKYVDPKANIRSLIQGHYHYPDLLLEAAYELVGYGYITGQTAKALHAQGIRGGTFNGAPVKLGTPGTPAPIVKGIPGGLSGLGL